MRDFAVHGSDGPPVSGIPPRRLTLANDLDHLSPPQAHVPRQRVQRLDAGQLVLLQAIALQQRLLLLGAQQDVAGHEVVVGDVDEQVLLDEGLDDGRQHDGRHLHGRRRQRLLRDQDARVEAVLLQVLREVAHLLDAQRVVLGELDPDRADGWGRLGVAGRALRRVLGDHGGGGVGLERQARAARKRFRWGLEEEGIVHVWGGDECVWKQWGAHSGMPLFVYLRLKSSRFIVTSSSAIS